MLRFDLQLPYIHIYTALMNKCYERLATQYIAWHFEIWKWHWTFEWGQTKTDNTPRIHWIMELIERVRRTEEK
ncbi:hypothetical protein FJZ33_02715 [Candidatus Poribacteria bacterium]|nr:hypothetical protein [Candidatus Poribacteria bacterium]